MTVYRDDEPKVRFEINQQVLVFIKEDESIKYIPCIPLETGTQTITRIPHMTWIKFRGLARIDGQLYMRFDYLDEYVHLSLSTLPYLEDIPQRNDWLNPKKKKTKPKVRTVASVKARGLRKRPKPGKRVKQAKTAPGK